MYKNQRDKRWYSSNNNNYNNNNYSSGTTTGTTKTHSHNQASGTSFEISVSQTYSNHSSKRTRSKQRRSFVSGKTFKMGDKNQNLSYPSRFVTQFNSLH